MDSQGEQRGVLPKERRGPKKPKKAQESPRKGSVAPRRRGFEMADQSFGGWFGGRFFEHKPAWKPKSPGKERRNLRGRISEILRLVREGQAQTRA